MPEVDKWGVKVRKLRINQADGWISEMYAEGSSKVEAVKRMAESMIHDPVRYPNLDKIYRQMLNTREQARTWRKKLEPVEDELLVPALLTPEQKKELEKERDRIAGEIGARLYKLDRGYRLAGRILGV